MNNQQLKQLVPHKNPHFPFRIFSIQPFNKEILHLHWHDEWEIIYITKGEGTFYIGAESIHAIPGDLLVINKGIIHAGFSNQFQDVKYYAIVFHPSLLGTTMADSHHLQIIKPYMDGKCVFPSRIQAGESYYDVFVDLIKKLITEYVNKTPGYQLAIKSILNLLIIHFSRHMPIYKQSQSHERQEAEINDKFKHLITYIEKHFSEKISVKQAASIVSMSTYHFCRTFKRITGKTFVQFLNLYRINEAERLLVETAHSITTIAEMVGYSNLNYFSQLFKEYKNISPSEYRKKTSSEEVNKEHVKTSPSAHYAREITHKPKPI